MGPIEVSILPLWRMWFLVASIHWKIDVFHWQSGVMLDHVDTYIHYWLVVGPPL